MTTDTQVQAAAEIGRARVRKEDARLVTGQTNWTDNIQLPGMLHMAFARSPHAHARITRVDLSAARSMPGVVAAFSGADFAGEQGSLPCAWPVTEDTVVPDHPPMATEEVRYVGEAVACVIARNRYEAADAAAAIDVDYDPLPPCSTCGPRWPTTRPRYTPSRQQDATSVAGQRRRGRRVPRRPGGDRAQLPAAADDPHRDGAPGGGLRAVRRRVHDLVGHPDPAHTCGRCSPWTPGFPEHELRVIAPDVGGGFGSKLQVIAEEVLTLLAARKLHKPVKWTESRSEGNWPGTTAGTSGSGSRSPPNATGSCAACP